MARTGVSAGTEFLTSTAIDSDSAAEAQLIAAGRIASHGRHLQVVAIAEDVVVVQADAAHVLRLCWYPLVAYTA